MNQAKELWIAIKRKSYWINPPFEDQFDIRIKYKLPNNFQRINHDSKFNNRLNNKDPFGFLGD